MHVGEFHQPNPVANYFKSKWKFSLLQSSVTALSSSPVVVSHQEAPEMGNNPQVLLDPWSSFCHYNTAQWHTGCSSRDVQFNCSTCQPNKLKINFFLIQEPQALEYCTFSSLHLKSKPSIFSHSVCVHTPKPCSFRGDKALKKGYGSFSSLDWLLQLIRMNGVESKNLIPQMVPFSKGHLGLCWMHIFKSYQIKNNSRHLSPCHNEAIVHIFNQPLLPFMPGVLWRQRWLM